MKYSFSLKNTPNKYLISTVAIIAVIALGFIGWRLFAGTIDQPIRTIEAIRQTIVKDISFTGTVEPKQSADIAFELSGVIKELYVSVGDTVTAGQKLALLDPQSVELELAKARADTAHTTSVERLSWQKASEDANNTIAENAKIAEQKRQAVRDAKVALDQSKEVFATKAVESGDDNSVTLAANSTVIANTAAYNSAKAALETTLLTIEKSNSTAQQAADIAYAQYTGALPSLAALESLARVKTNKSIIRAPFDGIVSKKNIELGELATTGNPVLTIETADTLQISADIPETDAFALAQHMEASVTFDAISSSKIIEATISQIYPAATSFEGVPTFHVVLQPSESNVPLRSGITSNVTVHAAKRDNVIAMPRRAIVTKSDKQFVRIYRAEEDYIEVEVTTGLIGSDGFVEIISGLEVGEKVIISANEENLEN